jgi:hypothetical protein
LFEITPSTISSTAVWNSRKEIVMVFVVSPGAKVSVPVLAM